MGHVRLGKLPKTREWREVVKLLGEGVDAAEIAAAVAIAAEKQFEAARGDPVFGGTVWLLAQLPLAARSDRFDVELSALGFAAGSEQSLLSIVSGFSGAVERNTCRRGGHTDLGELAREAACESLSVLVGSQLPGLFGSNPKDLQIELAKFATKDRFARLTRDFFSRLTNKTLDYYLSRVIAEHVGPQRTFQSFKDHSDFQHALALHCRETSEIVEQFAGGWFSRANYNRTLTPESAQGFADYALKKMRAELRARRAGNG